MDVRPHIKSRNHINSKRMSELLCCSQLLSSPSPTSSPASSLSRCPSMKSIEMYPRLDTCCCHVPDRDHDMDTFLRHNMMISSERRRRDLPSSSSNFTPIKADTCSRNERYHRRRRESSRVSSFLWSCYSSVASYTTCSSYSSSSSSSSLPSFSSLFHSNFLPTLLTMILIISGLLRFAEACSSRSTPKPRPPSPTSRPNITFQTYACPEAYAKWYCLNGATCFSVRIGESILYNCECADGYMGQRCEFKDLDGSYLPRDRLTVEKASLIGGPVVAVLFAFIFILLTLKRSPGTSKRGEDEEGGGGTAREEDLTQTDFITCRSQETGQNDPNSILLLHQLHIMTNNNPSEGEGGIEGRNKQYNKRRERETRLGIETTSYSVPASLSSSSSLHHPPHSCYSSLRQQHHHHHLDSQAYPPLPSHVFWLTSSPSTSFTEENILKGRREITQESWPQIKC